MRSLWQKQKTYKNYTLYARGKKKLTTLKQLAIKPSLSFGGGKRNRTDDPLLAWVNGIEPMTPCLRGRRSPN